MVMRLTPRILPLLLSTPQRQNDNQGETAEVTVTQAPRPGRAHKISGVILIGAGFLFQSYWWGGWREGGWWVGVLVFLLGVLMSCLGAFLLYRGRQYATKADAERTVTDSYPHVLYLRAFRSDESTRGYVFPKAFFRLWAPPTLEEQLADALRPLGYLIAVGQPGEGLPKPGAARIYASDDEWKDVVKRQMQAALLVTIRAGVGENLLWEAKEAIETLNPQKVLIFVFSMKAKHYKSFRTRVTQILGVSLPEDATLRRRFGRVSGFIGFDTDWKPIVFRFSPSLYNTWNLTLALRPVFERFGLK
jgi:hypothetical protein